MDTGEGKLTLISEKKAEELEKKDVGTFRVGDEVEIKGSKFVIHAIRPKKIILKLLRQ